MLQLIRSYFNKSHINTCLLLFLPLFFKYLFVSIFVNINLFTAADVIEDVIFYSVILFLITTIRKSLIVLFFVAVYMFYIIIETTSYMAVSSNFTSSFMYLLIETSKEEFNEFASSYLNYKIFLFILILLFSFLILKKHVGKTKKKNGLVFSLAYTFLIIILLKVTGLIESNAYHNIVRGTYGYFELQNNFNLSKDNIAKADLNITSDNEILVIVIGESTARGHLQLYGYNKETTPLLNSIKDSLFIYNNVISTDVLTLKAVPKMLSSISQENDGNLATDLIDIFNGAGYKTFWLSNQRPISYHDNAINEIASGATYFKFFNHLVDKHATVLDEVMLPKYKRLLNYDGKKVIVFRLIGTHFDYNKRYPNSFNKFKPSINTEKERVRSHYDNAVLYNDYIVFSILEELKKQNKKSALIYFSDHGENVFDDGDFFGRSEANLKQNMFEIPFILWTSKDFEKPFDFDYKKNRKFMTDHFYESVGHLFGVMHKNMDASKSIFSASFKERTRIVVNDINFDKHFLKE